MITENKAKHIFNVARMMKENAEKIGLNAEEMFTLGLVHDIGFEFGDSSEHHVIGAQIMESQGYKYVNEILYHGFPDVEYHSLELDLLNWCDMQVDSKGNVVSFEERLEDIKSRRGEDSPIYKNCVKLISHLKETLGDKLNSDGIEKGSF
ncbi:MAG: HD domain-containing protein [Clostridia bacterium]|nr:HD domain-containing protein [Clostridia bacterium]